MKVSTLPYGVAIITRYYLTECSGPIARAAQMNYCLHIMSMGGREIPARMAHHRHDSCALGFRDTLDRKQTASSSRLLVCLWLLLADERHRSCTAGKGGKEEGGVWGGWYRMNRSKAIPDLVIVQDRNNDLLTMRISPGLRFYNCLPSRIRVRYQKSHF